MQTLQQKVLDSQSETKKLQKERDLEIFRKSNEGFSYNVLAREYELTPTRIGQIVVRVRSEVEGDTEAHIGKPGETATGKRIRKEHNEKRK
jgi:hypothetical protein